jgi:hypothetical protein
MATSLSPTPPGYAAAVALALSPLRRARSPVAAAPAAGEGAAQPSAAGEAAPGSAPFPYRFPPAARSWQEAPAAHSASAAAAAAFFDGQDIARAVGAAGALAGGHALSGLVGAWGFASAAYDELDAGAPSARARALMLGDDEALPASASASASAVAPRPPPAAMLCGSHEARLTLRADGSFRARARHVALGPGAGGRSVELEARGRWAYLLGEQRLALAPRDSRMRVSVEGLELGRDADRVELCVCIGGPAEAADGAPPRRAWITLRYALVRDDLADARDAEDDEAEEREMR